jgi:curli biogenesis system outer membrane secretion channel CsgG
VKKRIAVAKFDAVGAYAAYFTGVDIGGGMSAQLTTALVESGRFVVVERAVLGEIQREQQLGAQRLATPELAAQAGKLLDAQMLIVGSVTEFEQAAKGGGMSIGLGGPLAGAGLGGKAVEGHVGMDIRLVDTTTGQVLTSKRAEARVPASDVSLKITARDVNFGGEAFNKTPLGQAARKAIEEAVALIVREMEVVPWTGRVADLLGDRVLVNAGRDMSLRPGMVLTVSGVVKVVTDPATGASLGVIEAPLGEIQIEQVQEKFSTARLLTGSLPKRGDLLRLKH